MHSSIAFFPVVTAKKFAEGSGLSEQVVRRWQRKGLIPSIEIGRYKLINLASLLTKLEEEDELLSTLENP